MSISVSDPVPRDARLERALDEGLSLPETGRIAVLRPGGADRLSKLPSARLHIVQGFRPDHDAFQRAGFATGPSAEGRYAAVLVCLPRARAQAQALLAEAVALSDGPVLVDGQKSDGVDSVLRAVRARCVIGGVIARAHGKLFWFTPRPDRLADWAARPLILSDPDAAGFRTFPGVFSADGVDPGSRLLASALPENLAGNAVDLGAGWGYLAAQLLRRPGLRRVDLVEAEHLALACARSNLDDPRAAFHWADATEIALAAPADLVVMNPPFHSGRARREALGCAFIASAARLLAPAGRLWMVANRHLPYASTLAEHFAQVEIIAEDRSYRVSCASRPRRVPDGKHRLTGRQRRAGTDLKGASE